MPSRRRSPNNRQRSRVEELVFRLGGDADCSGVLRFLPDEIVVSPGEYNLPVRVILNVPVCFLADFGRHGTGQGQASWIFQEPCPGLGIEPIPLVLEVHSRVYRLPVWLFLMVNSVQITPEVKRIIGPLCRPGERYAPCRDLRKRRHRPCRPDNRPVA